MEKYRLLFIAVACILPLVLAFGLGFIKKVFLFNKRHGIVTIDHIVFPDETGLEHDEEEESEIQDEYEEQLNLSFVESVYQKYC
ncbi:MAG: hypothetical protein J6Y72_10430 [Bacteroidales bacterium]|nr:hypothetical protein [Bacteroidales bacterium]